MNFGAKFHQIIIRIIKVATMTYHFSIELNEYEQSDIDKLDAKIASGEIHQHKPDSVIIYSTNTKRLNFKQVIERRYLFHFRPMFEDLMPDCYLYYIYGLRPS